MLYDPNYIPTNVEELYTSGWVDFMRLKISSYNLNDINNSVEDILQDMMVQMLNNGYVESYREDGRPFTVYLSVFIFNFMSKRYKKEHGSKHGQDIILSRSLEEKISDSDDADTSVVSLEHLEDTSANFDNYTILVESLREDLKDFKATSSVEFEGKIYQRDPLTVLELLMEGLSVAEIATIFQTSKQFVYLLIQRIRNTNTLLDY